MNIVMITTFVQHVALEVSPLSFWTLPQPASLDLLGSKGPVMANPGHEPKSECPTSPISQR